MTGFSILLEPWKAGESVASLIPVASSETSPRAWAYKRAKVFLGLDSRAL